MPSPPAFENKKNCYACGTGFGLKTRRHHCRNCGKTVCQKCSPNQLPLPHLGIEDKERVCNNCHNELTAVGKSSPRKATAKPEPVAQPVVEAPIPKQPKPVINCTCGLPMCICEPEPEPEKKKEEKETEVKKEETKPKAVAAKPKSSSAFSGFGFGKQKWDLTKNLNEQCRDAIKLGDHDGVKTLLEAGASAKYTDRQGNPLVHLAAMFNRFEDVKLLVSLGCDIWVKNPAGETAVDLAPPALAKKMRELQPRKD